MLRSSCTVDVDFMKYIIILLDDSITCVFIIFRYFINFLLDTTIGLVLIWLCIRIFSILAKLKGWRSLSFGEYGKIFDAISHEIIF